MVLPLRSISPFTLLRLRETELPSFRSDGAVHGRHFAIDLEHFQPILIEPLTVSRSSDFTPLDTRRLPLTVVASSICAPSPTRIRAVYGAQAARNRRFVTNSNTAVYRRSTIGRAAVLDLDALVDSSSLPAAPG